MYDYKTEKTKLYSAEGLKLYTAIRDQVRDMLNKSGAVTMGNAIQLPKGIRAADSWELMACVDMMVENKELTEIPTQGWAQGRIFIKKV